VGTQSKSYRLFSIEKSLSRILVGATLLSSVTMNGCQPGRQPSSKGFEAADGLPWASQNSPTASAWQALQEAGIPARQEPQVMALFKAMTGEVPSQQGVLDTADVAQMTDLSLLHATYQKLWCDISPYLDGTGSEARLRTDLKPAEKKTAMNLKSELWKTYNQIKQVSSSQELQRNLREFVDPAGSAGAPTQTLQSLGISVIENPAQRMEDAKQILAMMQNSTAGKQVGASQNYPNPRPEVKPKPKPVPLPAPQPLPDLPPGAPDSCSNAMFMFPPFAFIDGGNSSGSGTFYWTGGGSDSGTPGVDVPHDYPHNPPPPDHQLDSVPGPSAIMGLLVFFNWARKIRTAIKQSNERSSSSTSK
jgi:hypothetical protein